MHRRTRIGIEGLKAAVALAMVAALASHPAGAQPKSDSAVAHRRATLAQQRFESIRRQNLPLEYSDSRGQCDAHIGRFCQWNSEDDTIEAKEPRVIRRARVALLATLDSAARRAPRDGWITGQRVRYLLEIRNDTAALRVARSCQAAEWWCAALEGLALQEGSIGEAPDTAFARALRTMPASERCRWTDMSAILEPEQRKRFGKVGCGRSEEIAERLWWLADPFWSLAGNDRRTEHYARHTMAKILEPARIAYNLSWSSDIREMIVRYGWARYWTRGPGTAFEPNSGAISGHEATPNYHFIPVSLNLDSVPAVSFDLDRDASAERYAPVVAERLFELDPQVAVFRRGDSALVVAAYDVSKRAEFDSVPVTASLVVARDERSDARLQSVSGARGAISVMVGVHPQLMSLEVLSSEARRAAWKRKGLSLSAMEPGKVSMSDVLLFEPNAFGADDLDAAMRSALGSATAGRGKVGIYWETYGLARTNSAMPVSLTLTRVAESTLRRIGQAIGLASRINPLTIRWSQMMSVGSMTSRSVVLDLSLIPRGKYVLRIKTEPPGSEIAATSRLMEVR